MLRVLPPLPLEAPPEYVAFVERHLARLRRDAALVVGEGRSADELYPEVLTDVATRWRLFELLRTRLGRPGAADAYLRKAFARRARRWQDQQLTPVEVEVWQVEQLPEPARPDQPPGPPSAERSRFARPVWASMALRLAPVLLKSSRLEVRPLAEAAVAWWHAYEARRRRRYVAAAVAFVLVMSILTRVSVRDADVFSGPLVGVDPACSSPAPVTSDAYAGCRPSAPRG
jgi:hypothetical protein